MQCEKFKSLCVGMITVCNEGAAFAQRFVNIPFVLFEMLRVTVTERFTEQNVRADGLNMTL